MDAPESHDRCVSPSLILAARVDRAAAEAAEAAGRRQARRSADATVKRAASDAMTELDDLASDGHLSSHAYDSLAKRLKTVYDAEGQRTSRTRRKLAIEYACDAPMSLCWAPRDVPWFTSSFLIELVRAKRRAIAKAPAGTADADAAMRVAADHANKLAFEAWFGELLEHLIGPKEEAGLDGECRRNALLLVLETDAALFATPVLHYLQTELSNWAPSDFFDHADWDLKHYLLELAPCLLPWMLEELDPADEIDAIEIESLQETADMAAD